MPICKTCNNELKPGAKFCTQCGSQYVEEPEQEAPAQQPVPPQEPVQQPQGGAGYTPSYQPVATPVGGAYQGYQQQYAPPQPKPVFTENDLPEAYRPMSPGAYFGYSLLFAIPLVGFILLIVFAVNNDKINRRNFARGQLISIAVGVALSIVLTILMLVFTASMAGSMGDMFEGIMGYLPY
ncbi:MAG: zinc ribbon domain-containing protein [Clostridia bacterium]|nr:zinc ribbon domain-containing protein [Clostridia bacterium]